MQELTIIETEKVNGGVWDRIGGAFVGGLTGGYSAVIASNGNYSGSAILKGIAAGAFAGVINPIGSIKGVVKVIATSAGSGAISVGLDELVFETDGK